MVNCFGDFAKVSIVAAQTAFMVLEATATVKAAVIGRISIEQSLGIQDILAEPNLLVEIKEVDEIGLPQSRGIPIFSKNLTLADVGVPFTINSSNNSNFGQIVSLLTNGVTENIYFEVTGELGLGSSIGTSESSLTFNNANDFQGFVTDTVTITVNSLDITIPGQNPNGDGIWTDFNAKYTLTVESRAVPESSALIGSGIALGFVFLLANKRRQIKHL